jgi:hypothetical protein
MANKYTTDYNEEDLATMTKAKSLEELAATLWQLVGTPTSLWQVRLPAASRVARGCTSPSVCQHLLEEFVDVLNPFKKAACHISWSGTFPADQGYSAETAIPAAG